MLWGKPGEKFSFKVHIGPCNKVLFILQRYLRKDIIFGFAASVEFDAPFETATLPVEHTALHPTGLANSIKAATFN